MRSTWLALLAAAWLPLPVMAQAVAGEAQLPALARHWLDQTLALQSARQSPPLRLQGSVGELDSRLRLAPCARVETFQPPGSRLWGRTRIGMRCLEGATRWTVFLPVTVKASGTAWALRRDVAPGAVLGEEDLMPVEADWAAESSPVLAERAQWQGQVAVRSLTAGQVLRQNMVRPAQVFQAGAPIRVLVLGGGFQISSQAQALSPGVVGQQARVRMDGGKIVSGLVLDAHTVRLEL